MAHPISQRAVQPTGFSAIDVNAASDTTFSLKLKNGAFTDPPTVTIPLTYTAVFGRVLGLLTSGAFTHWRICATAGATPSGYLRWSEMFLGSSLVFDRTFDIGFNRRRRRLGAINEDVLARGPGPMILDGDYLRLTYSAMSTADRGKMTSLWEWQRDRVNRLQRSFFVFP